MIQKYVVWKTNKEKHSLYPAYVFHYTDFSVWSIYTSVGNTAADKLADCIAKAAAVHLSSMKQRGEWSDGDIDYEEGFYLLRHTLCPCVLTENGFMTNEKECQWLMTEDAIESIAMTHVDGITGYLLAST